MFASQICLGVGSRKLGAKHADHKPGIQVLALRVRGIKLTARIGVEPWEQGGAKMGGLPRCEQCIVTFFVIILKAMRTL